LVVFSYGEGCASKLAPQLVNPGRDFGFHGGSPRLGVVVSGYRREFEMLAKMNTVVIADNPASAVREFFLQHKVRLDKHALFNGCHLYFGSRCGMAVQLYRLLINEN
jgi:hypothetical protein